MADTIRPQTEWRVTLLADNTSGDISPQDLRDSLVSMAALYGGMSVQDGTVTGSMTTTPVKISPFANEGAAMPTSGLVNGSGDPGVETNLATGEITANCAGDYEVHICGAVDSDLNRDFTFTVRNNNIETALQIRHRVEKNGKYGMGTSGILTLAVGDVLSIWGEVDAGSAANVTFVAGVFWLKRLF